MADWQTGQGRTCVSFVFMRHAPRAAKTAAINGRLRMAAEPSRQRLRLGSFALNLLNAFI